MERENSEQPLASKNNQRIVLYLTLLAGLLAFWGLGNNDLWDDEAFTAVYGQNLVETGQLIAWDGRNLMAYGMLGWMSEDMINTHSPPLQYIVAGLSLAIFGDSAAGGRTLFVLIGLISIPLFATWYRHEFDSDDFWIVALILVLSIPFLLYIRQLRYYSLGLTSFAGLLWVWAVIRHVKQYRWWFLLGTLFLCLLVLSQYLYAAGAVAVMGISLVRERYRNRKNFTFLAMVAVVGLVSAIWFFLRNAQVMGQVMNSGEIGQLDKFARLLFMVPRDMARFEFFPVGMLLFAAGGVWALGRAGTTHLRDIFLVLAYGAGVITAVSLVSLQKPPSINIDADMRYYIFLIPLSAVVAAKIYELLRETRFPGVAPLFLVVLISSNVLTLNFFGPIGLHSRLVQYVGEVMNDYTTGSEAVSRYIEEEISTEECIFIVPTSMTSIQLYYHPLHKFCGQVTNQTPFAKKHEVELRPDLFWENTVPDYVIVGGRTPDQMSQLLAELYGQGGYELEAAIPVLWANLTRPEIPWRTFAPILIQDPLVHGVLIFHRTSEPAHPPTIGALEVEKYIQF